MLWIILGSVFGLLLLVYLVGFFLPAAFDVEVSVDIGQPVERVWAAVSDVERTPVSSHMCKGFERLPDRNGMPCWRENLGSSVITVRTVSQREHDVVRELEDSVVPLRARWQLRLESTPNGTRVALAQNGRVDRGTWHVPIFRVVVALGGIAAGMRAYGRRLTEVVNSSSEAQVHAG